MRIVKLTNLLLGVWIIALACTTYTTVPVWQKEFSLWAWMHIKRPDNRVVRQLYMAAAAQERRYDLVEQEAKRIQDKDGALDVIEQMMLTRALVARNDSSALDYMEPVIEVIPKFHEFDNRYGADRFLISSMQISQAYYDYAHLLMMYRSDIEGAIKNIEISKWYLREGERLPALVAQIIFLRIAGRHEEASLIIGDASSRFGARLEPFKTNARSIYSMYCKNYKTANCSLDPFDG